MKGNNLLKFSCFLMTPVLAIMLYNSALAVELKDLGVCYTRNYSAAHMRSQPKQNVTSLALKIDAEEKVVALSGTNRAGQFGYHGSFVCRESAGSATLTSCDTFESDSQLWIEQRSDGGIVIKTRNTFLSDIGEGFYHVDDNRDNYYFFLEEARHSTTIGMGPFFYYRLNPAPPSACPETD